MKIEIVYEKYLSEFQSLLGHLDDMFDGFDRDRPQKSMWNVELFLIYCFVRHYKPETVFESGLWKGRSSVVLASAVQKNGAGELICADITGLPEAIVYQREIPFKIIGKAGEVAVDKISRKRKVIMVIDGPKPGSKAADILYSKASKFQNLLCVFQHDAAKKSKDDRARLKWKAFVGYGRKFDGYKVGCISQDFRSRFSKLDTTPPKLSNLGYFLK